MECAAGWLDAGVVGSAPGRAELRRTSPMGLAKGEGSSGMGNERISPSCLGNREWSRRRLRGCMGMPTFEQVPTR